LDTLAGLGIGFAIESPTEAATHLTKNQRPGIVSLPACGDREDSSFSAQHENCADVLLHWGVNSPVHFSGFKLLLEERTNVVAEGKIESISVTVARCIE
ncbi:MAG: hypothetical protein SFU86_02730, partial [Pirellulaceae bacterium]|nr:hypothetical protein [Pirellulaceae bacterium]